ncbi:hypothetical protein ES703_114904 [subsurface metagenome]
MLKLPLIVPPTVADTQFGVLGVCPGDETGCRCEVLFDSAETKVQLQAGIRLSFELEDMHGVVIYR